jgi:hypothetical protein
MNDVTGNQVPKTICKAFLHMSAGLSIQQVNDHPTRENNILDLLFTSHPGHVERCKTLPPIGNSDHDILMVDISTNAYKPRLTRRKIFLWKKADLENRVLFVGTCLLMDSVISCLIDDHMELISLNSVVLNLPNSVSNCFPMFSKSAFFQRISKAANRNLRE